MYVPQGRQPREPLAVALPKPARGGGGAGAGGGWVDEGPLQRAGRVVEHLICCLYDKPRVGPTNNDNHHTTTPNPTPPNPRPPPPYLVQQRRHLGEARRLQLAQLLLPPPHRPQRKNVPLHGVEPPTLLLPMLLPALPATAADDVHGVGGGRVRVFRVGIRVRGLCGVLLEEGPVLGG